MSFLNSRNPANRALSARAMGLIHEEKASYLLEGLLSDDTEVHLFIRNNINIIEVKDLAMEALMFLKPEKRYNRPAEGSPGVFNR